MGERALREPLLSQPGGVSEWLDSIRSCDPAAIREQPVPRHGINSLLLCKVGDVPDSPPLLRLPRVPDARLSHPAVSLAVGSTSIRRPPRFSSRLSRVPARAQWGMAALPTS